MQLSLIRPGDRYFVQGMREELDAPWRMVCSIAMRASCWSIPHRLPKRSLWKLPTHPILIGMRKDASHIRIEGLTLQCASGTAINMVGSQHCEITWSTATLQHTGDLISGHGVAFLEDGRAQPRHQLRDLRHRCQRCLYYAAATTKLSQRAEHLVQNNHIHHTGVINTHSAGNLAERRGKLGP